MEPKFDVFLSIKIISQYYIKLVELITLLTHQKICHTQQWRELFLLLKSFYSPNNVFGEKKSYCLTRKMIIKKLYIRHIHDVHRQQKKINFFKK